MPRNLYRDPLTNDVFEYDDDQVASGIVRSGLVKMSSDEIAAHLNPAPSVDQQRAEIFAELDSIDAASARPLRAILVGSATDGDRTRLAELDARACVLRAELASLAPTATL